MNIKAENLITKRISCMHLGRGSSRGPPQGSNHFEGGKEGKCLMFHSIFNCNLQENTVLPKGLLTDMHCIASFPGFFSPSYSYLLRT